MDNPDDVSRLTSAVLKMLNAPETSKDKALAAQRLVQKLQKQTMSVLRKILP
jgi:hypothetical protein